MSANLASPTGTSGITPLAEPTRQLPNNVSGTEGTANIIHANTIELKKIPVSEPCIYSWVRIAQGHHFDPDTGEIISNMVVEVKRTVKLVTEQATIPDREPEMEGFPMKLWSIEIFLLDEAGNPTDSSVISKAVYNLHPSFANPVQTFDKPPFRCENEGWGEFDMTIDLFAAEKGGKHQISHDLNFAKARYEAKHVITFRNPSSGLLALLSKSGPIPGDEVNGARKKGGSDEVKKRKRPGQIDMDKLAEGLTKLNEDDLLSVVQMIHDNKTDDTYTKNDVENGEFHVDLYTLTDALLRMLWDFVIPRAF